MVAQLRKPMLAVLTLCIAALMAIAITGCSGQEGSQQTPTTQSQSSSAPVKDAIKIGDVGYSVDNAVVDGHRRVVLGFTNNSKYEIASCRFDFVVNPEATDEEIATAYAGMNDIYYDPAKLSEDLKNYGVWCESNISVELGAASRSTALQLGMYYLNDMKQYDILVLDMVTVSYVNNGKLYKETYDARNDSYTLDPDAIDINQWSTSELASIVPKPEGVYITDIQEYDNQLCFDASKVSQEQYEAYVSAVKEAGFNSDVHFSDTMFDAHSADGKYDFNLYYNPDNQEMNLIMNVESDVS